MCATTCCPCYPWFSYVLGYAVACFGADLIVRPVVVGLRSIAEKDFQEKKVLVPNTPIHPAKQISFWHGVVERAVYATSVILGKPEGIAVWLAFKVVTRWKISEEPDARHIPGTLIYMIGTALNVGFGILGGFIALGRWSF